MSARLLYKINSNQYELSTYSYDCDEIEEDRLQIFEKGRGSLLLLYHRLFSVNRPFRIALIVAGVLVLMWCLASFWDTIFECVPVQAEWDKSIKNARCQSIRALALGSGISNLILDVIFLLLPVPMVWQLHVSKRIKMSLTGIFLLGGLYVTSTRSVFAVLLRKSVSVQLQLSALIKYFPQTGASQISPTTASASTYGVQSNLAVR